MKRIVLMVLITFITSLSAAEEASKKKYIGAEVFSLNKVQFGKFEIRTKMVSAPGVVSSFFLYDNESWQGHPYPWREIDIESLGKKKDCMQTNLITGFADKRITSEELHTVNNIDGAYHTYTLEWTPDYIAWYVDGKLFRKDTAKESQQVIDMRDKPQSYRMNLWIAEWEDWVGPFNRKALPLFQYVNWIKYYEYTPGKGKNNFSLKWTDDFDTFDTKRWGKGDWSFDGNLAQFEKQSAVIKDGYLILCLTDKLKKGLSGKFHPDK